jgi:hypothetical protein
VMEFAPHDMTVEGCSRNGAQGCHRVWEWGAPKAANLIFQGIFAHQNYDEALTAMGPRWG